MMSEAVVTFQSQLSGVMETVFKAAMYEITRLVEDSFLEEVTRSREQVETLKRRLKSSESRRKDRLRDGERAAATRCVDCGRVGLSTGGEEGGEMSAMQTQTDVDHKLKQEGVVKEIHSCRGMDELGGPDTNSSVKSPGVGNEKLNRLLKEEVLNITSDSTELPGKWHVNLDGEEESNLSGPSTGLNDREIQQCQDEWDTGLDQRPDPSLEGDATDPSEPLYRARCGMEDLGGFGKTGYGGGHNMFDMSSLAGLQESPPRLAEELTYMGHYEGDLGASDHGTVHTRSHQPAPTRSRRGANLGSPVDPPPRPNMDVDREFSCMLINEQGYLQDPSALYPEHMSGGEAVNRASGVRVHGGHIGDHSLQNSDVYTNPSETYSLTLNLEERLQQHQTTGAAAKAARRQHNCNQCSASFADAASLKAHKLTHKAGGHAGHAGPPFSCNQCGKTFTQACNLKVHQRIHSGQGLHLCSHCGKGFPSFSELKAHKCSQTGDKPYCCGVCGNKFSRLWNLKLHRRIHTQEKPHQCTMCDKSFTRADILKVHQRTHTGERPYCCTICGLSFKRLDHLKSHQRKHRPTVCKPEAGWGEIGLN